MDVVVCPHCKSHRIASTTIPKDVVVVMPCPSCHELSVLFRNKVIPLDRHVIEQGSFDERKEHFAHIIAMFLEAGMFPLLGGEDEEGAEEVRPKRGKRKRKGVQAPPPENENPISEKEFDKFVRIDLKCIDNPAYFRKHFG